VLCERGQGGGGRARMALRQLGVLAASVSSKALLLWYDSAAACSFVCAAGVGELNAVLAAISDGSTDKCCVGGLLAVDPALDSLSGVVGCWSTRFH
jgi:hypothetical protein